MTATRVKACIKIYQVYTLNNTVNKTDYTASSISGYYFHAVVCTFIEDLNRDKSLCLRTTWSFKGDRMGTPMHLGLDVMSSLPTFEGSWETNEATWNIQVVGRANSRFQY